MKQRRRMELAKHRQQMMMTGGGPQVPPVDNSIVDVIAPHLLVEVEGAYDSENTMLPKNCRQPAEVASDSATVLPEIIAIEPAETTLADSMATTSHVDVILDAPGILQFSEIIHPTPASKKQLYKMKKTSLLESVANEHTRRTKSLADFDRDIYEHKLAAEKAKREEAELSVEIAQIKKREAEARASEAEWRLKIAEKEYQERFEEKK